MRTLRRRRGGSNADHYLDGQLLVAMPLMTDKRFARSVIYICAHSAEGAMGLIVNQRAPNIRFAELLQRLSITPGQGELSSEDIDLDVHVGGPGYRWHVPRRDVTWWDQERQRCDVGCDRAEELLPVRVTSGEHALAERVRSGMKVTDDAQVLARVEGGQVGGGDLQVR